MVTERDEAGELGVPEADSVGLAFASVMSAIIETVPDGPARRQAVGAVMEAHGYVRDRCWRGPG